MNDAQISIIIRTLNEGHYLPSLLEAIAQQKSPYIHECIIVDSGSTDETLQIAKRFGCRILQINRQEFSFGRSLNIGCEAAKGKFLAIISGHCVPCHDNWLELLIDPLTKGQAEYSYGRQIGGPESHWSEQRIFAKYFPEKTQRPQQGFYCNNANSAILRSTWERHRFNEVITGLEDMHLAQQLVKAGGRLGYVSEATVYHHHHESWKQVLLRFEREALALLEISPEMAMRKRDFMRYLPLAIASDLRHLFTHGKPTFKVISSIFFYRLCQYWGGFQGSRRLHRLTAEMRDSYFFPTLEKGKALEPSPSSNPTHSLYGL
jgi:rhamnosyltransferase